jgi:hypothetical protein
VVVLLLSTRWFVFGTRWVVFGVVWRFVEGGAVCLRVCV